MHHWFCRFDALRRIGEDTGDTKDSCPRWKSQATKSCVTRYRVVNRHSRRIVSCSSLDSLSILGVLGFHTTSHEHVKPSIAAVVAAVARGGYAADAVGDCPRDVYIILYAHYLNSSIV